jgi:hypothetical protein
MPPQGCRRHTDAGSAVACPCRAVNHRGSQIPTRAVLPRELTHVVSSPAPRPPNTIDRNRMMPARKHPPAPGKSPGCNHPLRGGVPSCPPRGGRSPQLAVPVSTKGVDGAPAHRDDAEISSGGDVCRRRCERDAPWDLDLGFGVWGFGQAIEGVLSKDLDLGFRVWGLGQAIEGVLSKDLDLFAISRYVDAIEGDTQ